MACPCEVLLECEDPTVAARAAEAVSAEAWRIEKTFSRYRDDNIVHAINTAQGRPVVVDPECARLLDFGQSLYEASAGLFDLTSGALRRVWKFDGSDRVPSQAEVGDVLRLVGWHKVRWRGHRLQMPTGMEIDFGGIGKEYAVDRAAELGTAAAGVPVLVNFGGDICATGPRADGGPWKVAIETLAADGQGSPPGIDLRRGGVATSGDARRFLLKDGVRYGHILDPRHGWPVPDAPRSVTVLEASCTQAGSLSTLAILQGRGAEEFLRDQKVVHWVMR